MLDRPDTFTVFAGLELLQAREARKQASVKRSSKRPDCYDSESLCAFQIAESRKRIVGAQLCETIYGWSIRYDSGIQNFGIIKHTINTFADAVAWGQTWVDVDPEHRYFWGYTKDVKNNV